ncbi:phage tail tape measure protein [Streptomyces chartreusis]|uniref:phage tail tape measure protein n=1 Tax=Streptomyces chartreusis TaxID=1969 RepID=UPI003433D654
MPVEVGVGYVSVVPETRGFGRLLNQQLSGESTTVGTTAGQNAGEGFLGGLGSKLKAGVAGVAAVGGALFAAGFAEAVEQDKSSARLGAQLGLTEKESDRAGKIAGKVFSKGYGESIDQVNDSLKSLAQNGVASINGPRKELAGLSKDALNLAEAFDADVGESAKAAGQLIRTGLVKNGREAFDLLTAGFQSGADKAGDLIDTVNEYSTQWRKAGLSGAQGIGLINQALQAGARDGDVAADAIKEFSIRAVDGSKTTADGWKALGLNADSMAAKFARGGKAANGVLDLTLDKLRGIKDPVKQSQIAVALFGTQAEDLGQSLLAMDPSTAAAGLGKVGGAADRMGKTLHNTATNNIEVFKRQALQGLATFADKYALPALSRFGGFLNTHVLPPAREVGGALVDVLVPAVKGTADAFAGGVQWVKEYGAWLIPAGIAIGGIAIVAGASTIATWGMTAAFSVYRGIILAVTAVTRGWAVVQGVLNAVMSANPIGLVVVGVLALAAAAVVAYNKVGWFRDLVQAAWSGIAAGWSWLWNTVLKPGFGYFMTGLRAIGSAASWLWSTVLQPTFSAIATGAKVLFAVVAVVLITPLVLAFKLLATVGMWLWNTALAPAFRGIGAAATWLATSVLRPMMAAGAATFRALGAAGTWLYRNAIQPAMRGIGAAVSWLWSSMIRPNIEFGKAAFRALGAAGTWLYRNAIQPAVSGIGSAAKWLYDKGIKPPLDLGKKAIDLFAGAFDTAQKAIGTAFGKVRDATRKPVAFIVNTVYTNGIKKVWDGVAGFVGLDKLPAAKFAGGGRTRGGTPGKDSIPSLLMADEFVVKRSSARSVGFGALEYINRTGELPVQRFADGGIVGDALSWVGDKARKIGGAVMDGVDFLANPGKLWNKATGFIRDKIAKIGQNKFAQMIGKVPLKMLSSLKDKVVSAATGMFGGGSTDVGGSGVKRWTSVVLQALKLVGQPASLLPVVLRRMNQESGGNPRAINNWDINAKNGDPSRGLMQTIGATFNAYAGKLRSRGIYDPLANIYASMRYALSRYGSLAAAYNRPGGYASGGRPRAGELAWVGEQGPELVRFGSGNSTVYDHRTSVGMAAGLMARGFAKGTSGARAAARKQVPGDLKSFTKSLTGSASQIASASKELAKDLRAAGGAGRSLAATTDKTAKRLQEMATLRSGLRKRIEEAQAAAVDQRKTATDYLGFSNLAEVTSVGGLISGMQERQGNLKNFQSLIKTAQKKGVSQSVIQQLVALGPDSNLARLVSGASAGDIKKINSLASSGAKLSTSYGNFMADSMYDSGKQAGAGFLAGLKAQEAELQKAMTKLGSKLVDAIEDRLDIHSPSRETERIGRQLGAGVVVGTDKSLAAVRAGAKRLATAALPQVVPAAAAAQASAGLRSGDTVVLRVGEHEFTAVVDERVDAGLSDVRKRSRAGSKKG